MKKTLVQGVWTENIRTNVFPFVIVAISKYHQCALKCTIISKKLSDLKFEELTMTTDQYNGYFLW
jgi:hypothetical protein